MQVEEASLPLYPEESLTSTCDAGNNFGKHETATEPSLARSLFVRLVGVLVAGGGNEPASDGTASIHHGHSAGYRRSPYLRHPSLPTSSGLRAVQIEEKRSERFGVFEFPR